MEENDDFLSYGVVEYGSLLTDDGLVTVAADTIDCGDDKTFSELVATAENAYPEFEFVVATLWKREASGDEGTAYVFYFA
jgi:hypothetical protein